MTRKSGPSARGPEAVFLDVGWTLIYPRQSIWELLSVVSVEAGGALRPETAEGLIHQFMTARRPEAVTQFEGGAEYADSNEEFAAQFLAMCQAVFGVAGVPGDPADLCRRFLDRFWRADTWAVFPDVLEGIGRLRERGLRVGVLSNADSRLVEFLDELGLLAHLDFTVVSAIEGTKKPDRRIFECALQRAGVDASAAVHVGDMYLEDILGARNAGVRAILIDRGPHRMFPNHPEAAGHPAEACEVVRDLLEVVAALEK